MKILHVEDSPLDAELTRAQLQAELPVSTLTLVQDKAQLIAALQGGSFDLILSDFGLVDFDGFEALQLAQRFAPGVPFIFLSGTIGEERAIEIMRAGAQDYVLKDRAWRLAGAITRAVAEAQEKRQRQEAESAHQRLVAILEYTPDFVGIAAPDGQLQYLNRAGRRLVGLPEEAELGSSHLHELVAAGPGVDLAQVWPAVLAEGTWTGELALHAPTGRAIPVSGVLLAHRSDDGAVAYVSAVLRDLRAQKEADRRLREQREYLDRATEAIFVEDLTGVITYWNQGAERTLGWPAQEAIGRPAMELFRPVDPSASSRVAATLARKDEWHGEIAVLDRAGQRRVLKCGFTVIRDDNGERRAALAISTDVSENKILEEKFLRAQRLESIGMLATGIAHDLNNVLAPVLLGVTMLRERDLEDDVVRILLSLERSAERGASLVRQILGFAHGMEGERRVFEVRHLLRDVAGVARETFPRNIRIEQEVERDLWSIYADPTQIHQVLLNLVVNARDAMPAGGILRLAAENRALDETKAAALPGGRPGAYLAVIVADTGSGMTPAVLERLWEPFFTTKGPGKGTGLGLATVRGIVENHHGFVTIDTRVGAGTTFVVYLPATEDFAAPDESAVPLAVPRGDNELILLVDDEAHMRELATHILTQHGYRVLAARDGMEAVALFGPRSDEIGVVVTDLQMPNLDGAALAAVLRRLNPAVKLIAASGLSDTNPATQPLTTLADAFLPKPFRAEDLLRAVHQLLADGAINADTKDSGKHEGRSS